MVEVKREKMFKPKRNNGNIPDDHKNPEGMGNHISMKGPSDFFFF